MKKCVSRWTTMLVLPTLQRCCTYQNKIHSPLIPLSDFKTKRDVLLPRQFDLHHLHQTQMWLTPVFLVKLLSDLSAAETSATWCCISTKKSPFTPEVKALAPLCREQGSISQHNASIRPFHLTEHKSQGLHVGCQWCSCQWAHD